MKRVLRDASAVMLLGSGLFALWRALVSVASHDLVSGALLASVGVCVIFSGTELFLIGSE